MAHSAPVVEKNTGSITAVPMVVPAIRLLRASRASETTTSMPENMIILAEIRNTEQSGTDAAESLGHDALVDMLDAVNLIADRTGGGIIAD